MPQWCLSDFCGLKTAIQISAQWAGAGTSLSVWCRTAPPSRRTGAPWPSPFTLTHGNGRTRMVRKGNRRHVDACTLFSSRSHDRRRPVFFDPHRCRCGRNATDGFASRPRRPGWFVLGHGYNHQYLPLRCRHFPTKRLQRRLPWERGRRCHQSSYPRVQQFSASCPCPRPPHMTTLGLSLSRRALGPLPEMPVDSKSQTGALSSHSAFSQEPAPSR